MKVRIELVDDQGKKYSGEVELSEAKHVGKPRAVGPPTQKEHPTLPERILGLREGGFFSKPKVSPEVFEEIKKKYYCQPDRVTMALIRLQKSQRLRKATKVHDGKKMNA